MAQLYLSLAFRITRKSECLHIQMVLSPVLMLWSMNVSCKVISFYFIYLLFGFGFVCANKCSSDERKQLQVLIFATGAFVCDYVSAEFFFPSRPFYWGSMRTKHPLEGICQLQRLSLHDCAVLLLLLFLPLFISYFLML